MKFFGLERVESPIQSGDEGIQDLHILPEGIAFVARDPEVGSATHTACSCYSCPILNWDWEGPEARSRYELSRYRGLGGSISSPVQDTKNGHLAFLSKKKDGYGFDKNRIIYIPFQAGKPYEIFESADGKGLWELSPLAISFAPGPLLLI
jgi:pre-mRNA-splicing helicase BRR2